MVTFTRADDVLKQVDNPDWFIKDVVEKESHYVYIRCKPKSGKSFIAIAMACMLLQRVRSFMAIKLSLHQ